eukprot:5279915-Amphidinium_carterae.2
MMPRVSSQGSSVPVGGSQLFLGFFRPIRWLEALTRVLPSQSVARGSFQGSSVPGRWLLERWLTGSSRTDVTGSSDDVAVPHHSLPGLDRDDLVEVLSKIRTFSLCVTWKKTTRWALSGRP